MRSVARCLWVAAIAFFAACSNGGGVPSGRLTVSVTDLPVDEVSAVRVQFSSLELLRSNEVVMRVELDAAPVDLVFLGTGGTQAELVDDLVVPAGDYDGLRLNLAANLDGWFDSTVELPGPVEMELFVPNLGRVSVDHPFSIRADRNTGLIIDWDLRRGLFAEAGVPAYRLEPVLRVIDDRDHGGVFGEVAQSLLADPACTADPNTGAGNLVYVFAGGGVVPDDADGIEPEPVSAGAVSFDGLFGGFLYAVRFLPSGEYTVAFTCQGIGDRPPDPADPAADSDDPIVFTAGVPVTVTHGANAQVDFN